MKNDELGRLRVILHPCPSSGGHRIEEARAPARAAFDENLTHYKAEIPQLFWFNALLIASNGRTFQGGGGASISRPDRGAAANRS